MKKRDKIIYWVATVWLSLGMFSTGLVQLLQVDEEREALALLGYPGYFLIIIGGWKILGVAAVLLPRLPLLKEWAYAGFFFVSTGAIISHVAASHPFGEIAPPLLLLVLTGVSWYFRPPQRRLSATRLTSQPITR